MNALTVLKWLDLGLTLLDKGTEFYGRLTTRRNKLKTIMDEGRDPTSEEWDEILGSMQDSVDRIMQS